jgi:hypothetical protein
MNLELGNILARKARRRGKIQHKPGIDDLADLVTQLPQDGMAWHGDSARNRFEHESNP